MKPRFNMSDMCLIGHAGAIDYLMQLNAKKDPMSMANQLIRAEKFENEKKKMSRHEMLTNNYLIYLFKYWNL